MDKKKVCSVSEIKKYISSTKTLTDRAIALTKKLESCGNQEQKNFTLFCFTEVAKDIYARLLDHLPSTIRIDFNCEHTLRLIYGSRPQLFQMLSNICDNAIDAMPNGGKLTITIKNKKIEKSDNRDQVSIGDYIELTVQDSGIGIPEKNIDSIYQPFFTTKPRSEGSGLGLSMVYSIVKAHRGTPYVRSQLDEGTTFVVLFPAEKANAREVENNMLNSLHAPQLKGKRILLIDEEADLVEIGKELLSMHGMSVIGEIDARRALAIFKKQHTKIDLVLLDVLMPKIDGYMMFKRMRKISPEQPILFISDYSDEGEIKKLCEGDKTGFLKKPFDEIALTQAIQKLLS